MSTYVLHYFDGAGRGEAIRIAFFLQGIHFTDRRFNFEAWKNGEKKGI
jgi:hypothetical protein